MSTSRSPKGGLAGGRVFGVGDAMSLPKCTDLKLGHTAELNADVAAENVSHLAKHGVASEHEKSNAGLATYPYGAVGAHTAPRGYCVSLGEAAGVLVFNGIVIEGMLAAITKPLLEWTKVAACAERPVSPSASATPRQLALAHADRRRRLSTSGGAAARPLRRSACCADLRPVRPRPQRRRDGHLRRAAVGRRRGRAAEGGPARRLDRRVHRRGRRPHALDRRAPRPAALRAAVRAARPPLIWIPRPLRDAGYKMVAAVRYRVFGKDDGGACRRMTKAIKARFLDHVA